MAAWGAGCGSNNDNGGFGNGDGDGGDGGIGLGNGGDAAGALIITPPNPTVNVTITNGVVTSAPVTFTAKSADGTTVSPTWGVDRGDLGSISGAGVFTASGNGAGVGNITATSGNLKGSTTVTVSIHAIQVGNPYGAGGPPPVGPGGFGGVGGEGLGGPVDSATQTALTGAGTPPSSPSVLGFLYPYDKTVFPRGMLAPLLQWQSNEGAIDAVSIHLTEKNYDFQGFYAVSGASQFHQPIDTTAWNTAINGNSGDPLHAEVKIHSGTTVIGPVAEDWTVASGILSGTIYYQTYYSVVAGSSGSPSAGTLEIRPGKTDPQLVLPSAQGACIVCHEVSEDGSTLFAEDSSYSNGASYDLRDGGAVIQSYTGVSNATSSDGTNDNEKFVWSALWKDGTFAFENKDDGDVETEQLAPASMAPQNIYRRDTANGVTSTGLSGVVTQAITPAFSHDGTKIAFNGWTLGAGAAPLTSGNGHTLDIMDFSCGTPVTTPGAPSCSTFAFSNLQRLYTNADGVNGYVGWPAWTPDNKGIVFHNVVRKPTGSLLQTRYTAEAQLWYTNVPASGAGNALLMNALNGLDGTGTPYVPSVADVTGAAPAHSDDVKYNYEPTVNPVASGGYFWAVFTSRRMYGNIANGDPYDYGDGTHTVAKKLWVAAIDINPTPGTDPSHPAFYLPGQELNAPNMRGFWVVDPCRADGASCDTGAECCGGFCRAGSDGGLVCQNPSGCANENEKCTTTADCCGGTSLTCINGFCVNPGPR